MALGLTPQEIIEKNNNPLLRINKSWTRVLLVKIAKVQNGYAFSSKYFNREKGIPLIRIRDIGQSNTENLYSGKFDPEYLVSLNDILIGMDGDFRATKWSGGNGLLNQRVCRLVADSSNYEKEFLFICLQPYLNAIHEETSSVTVKHLSSNTIKNIPLPLPPLPIQRAIVTKIETLFDKINKGIAELKKAQEQLIIYRQAVLKKAFQGELTKGKRKPEIIKLGTVIDKPRYGTSKKCSLEPNGIAVLRIPNIGEGIINTEVLKYASFDEKEIATLELREGDILTIRSNGSVDLVGKCAIISKNDTGYLYAGYLIRVRPLKEKIDSKYLLHCLSSHELRVQIESKAKSTSGVNNINSGELQSLIISLFPLEDQRHVVQEIESRLSVCHKVEQSIIEALERSEALRQSILKKAFEGRLLSKTEIEGCKQEPDYKPASELLKKIIEEKK